MGDQYADGGHYIGCGNYIYRYELTRLVSTYAAESQGSEHHCGKGGLSVGRYMCTELALYAVKKDTWN